MKEEVIDPDFDVSLQDEDDDDTDWYHCGLCGFKNLELKVMAKHAATKHQQGVCYVCAHCDRVFKKKSSMVNHKEKKHSMKEELFFCEECKLTFPTENNWFQHMLMKHPEMPVTSTSRFQCDFCEKNYTTPQNLKRHVKQNHPLEGIFDEAVNVEESGKAGCKKESATNVESESLQAGDEVAIKTQDSEGDAPPDDFEYESPEDHDDDEWKPDSPQTSWRVTIKEENMSPPSSPPAENDEGEEAAPNTARRRSGRRASSTTRRRSQRRAAAQHECPECGKVYQRARSLKEHMTTHSGEKGVVCHLCNTAFTWSSSLNVHLKSAHNLEKLPCPFPDCEKEFSVEYKLKVHMRQHTGERPFKCERCGKTYTQASHLKEHAATHEEVKPFRCETCGEVIHPSKRELHNVHAEKGFSRAERLKVHMRRHTGERPYSCHFEDCGKAFARSGDLLKHHWTHGVGEPKHSCDICGKDFHRKGDLTRHKRAHDNEVVPENSPNIEVDESVPPSKRKVACDVCGKVLSNKGSLVAHSRIHTGEKPFLCSHCGKGFKTTSQLKTHAGIHLKVRRYKCDKCPRSYMVHARLLYHQTLHTGQHNYQCEICGKSFRWDLSYRQHMKHHTDPHPHKCNICGKTFGWPTSLKYHLMKHSAKKNFSCRKCNQTFAVHRSLVSHMRHPCSATEQYTCKICGVMHKFSSVMRRHYEQFHRDQVELNADFFQNIKAKVWRCRGCQMTFATNSALIRHKKENEECRMTALRLYHCRVCNRNFTGRSELNRHYKESECGQKRSEEQGKNKSGKGHFQCHQCGKEYLYESSLRKHLEKHRNTSTLTEEGLPDEGMPSIERLAKVAEEIGGRYKLNKNAKITEFDYTVIRSLVKRAFVIGQEGIPRWICALCSTEFPDAVKLRDHIGSHMGEKKVLCPICGKYVMDKWKATHQRSHEEKQKNKYVCHICSKELSCKATLRAHVRAHSGKKEFSCPHCTKAFTWPSGLTYHLKVHFDDLRYSCHICCKKFVAPYNLKVHMKAAHPGEPVKEG